MPRRLRGELSLASDDKLTVVIPGCLFLGGADCSLDYSELRSRGITHIINCTRGVCADARLADFTFLRVAVEDCPTVNISEAFEPACALIGTARDAGGATLVHCRKGISRSATIVLAWLVKHEGMTALDALRYLQSCRPLISPNAGFMAQLLELEQALRGQTTIDMDKYRQDRFALADSLGWNDVPPTPSLHRILSAPGTLEGAAAVGGGFFNFNNAEVTCTNSDSNALDAGGDEGWHAPPVSRRRRSHHAPPSAPLRAAAPAAAAAAAPAAAAAAAAAEMATAAQPPPPPQASRPPCACACAAAAVASADAAACMAPACNLDALLTPPLSPASQSGCAPFLAARMARGRAYRRGGSSGGGGSGGGGAGSTCGGGSNSDRSSGGRLFLCGGGGRGSGSGWRARVGLRWVSLRFARQQQCSAEAVTPTSPAVALCRSFHYGDDAACGARIA